MTVASVVAADGTRISYLRVGSGRPVVVVHGGLGSRVSWLAVAERLAERNEFLLVDRRGRGDSGFGVEPHSLDREVDDVLAVLADAGPAAVLVGHSYGGALVLDAARRATSGLAGVFVYEPALTSYPSAHGDTSYLDELDRLVSAGELESALVAGLTHMADSTAIRRDELESALAAKPSPAWDALVVNARTLPRELRAVATAGWPPGRFANLAVPVRVLVGARSGMFHQRNCADLAAAVREARLVHLDGQGHVAHLTAPEALARALADFLDTVGWR